MFCDARIDWAAIGSWVQAITTVIAIYVAARLATRDRITAADETAGRRLIATVGVFREALELLQDFEKFTGPVKVLFVSAPPQQERFNDVLSHLQAVPVFEMADFDQIQDVFRVRKAIRESALLAANFESEDWDRAKVNAELAVAVGIARDAVNKAVTAIRPHIENKAYGARLRDKVLGRRQ